MTIKQSLCWTILSFAWLPAVGTPPAGQAGPSMAGTKAVIPDSANHISGNPPQANPPDSTQKSRSVLTDSLKSVSADSISSQVPVVADSLLDSAAVSAPDSLETVPGDTLSILDMQFKTGPLMSLLKADSSLGRGSRYGSFADLFDQLPATFFMHHGSVGQMADGSLFSAHGAPFILDYDGLILNDPLTGAADLNLLPVQSIEQFELITSGHGRRFGLAPAGQLLQVDTRNMAALPVKTRVAYRTGDNGYDEVDARLGMLASQRLAINAGGVLKSYGGTTLFSDYKAQKINAKIDIKLNPTWTARYLLLYNIFNRDEPFLNFETNPGFYYYHHKDYRFDHGFRLQRGRFFTAMLQYTALHRELYTPNRNIIKQQHEIDVVRLTTRFYKPVGGLDLNAGLNGEFLHPISNRLPARSRYSTGAWGYISSRPRNKLFWNGGIRLEKQRDYDMFIQPEFSLTFTPKDSFKIQLWASQQNTAPGLYALHADEPFKRGAKDLKPSSFSHAGAGIEIKNHFFDLYAALSATLAQDRIAEQPESTASDTLVYTNLPRHVITSADLFLNAGLYKGLSAWTKLKLFLFPGPDSRRYRVNIPDACLQGYLQYRNIYFQNNLDLSLRMGCTFMNARPGPEPWYAPVSPSATEMGLFIIPYVHAIFAIKDVVLFISLHNFTGQEYQHMYGYPMPGSQLRWGVVWRFDD